MGSWRLLLSPQCHFKVTPPPRHCSFSVDRRAGKSDGRGSSTSHPFWSLSTHISEMESFSLLTREDRIKTRNESETYSGALKKCNIGHVVAILSHRKVFNHTQNSVCKLSGWIKDEDPIPGYIQKPH